MRRLGIVDKPKSEERKIHSQPTPLGGGWAIFVSFFVILSIIFLVDPNFFGDDITPKYLLGIFIGGLILMLGGILDDKYTLRARYQIWFPIIATLTILAFGIGPHIITSPWGGTIDLSVIKIPIDGLGNLVVLADAIVFFWLMGMMFTTKFLDGLDGLVTGVVSVGALIIFALSLTEQFYQPEVALLAIIFVGACLGFLIWNWHPAKVFLGEGGSLFTGFMLGVLAIISGGKIVTTILVMGLPALDVARVLFCRWQKHKPIFVGDDEHLHFKLLASGFTQRQAVLLLYSISFAFGLSALFLQSAHKLVAFVVLFIVMILVVVWLGKKREKNEYGRKN